MHTNQNKKQNKNKSLVVLTLVANSGLTVGTYDNTGEQIEKAMLDTSNAIEDTSENIKEGLSAKRQDCEVIFLNNHKHYYS